MTKVQQLYDRVKNTNEYKKLNFQEKVFFEDALIFQTEHDQIKILNQILND